MCPEIRIKETVFGEQARKKMAKKEQTAWRRVFLQYICALLNCGGGVLHVGIANKEYEYDRDALGEDLEQGLNEMLNPEPLQDFIKVTQHGKELRFHVKSWCSAERRARLCTRSSGLLKRSGTSVLHISPADVRDYFLKRCNRDKGAGEDQIHKKARQFYEGGSAKWGVELEFGESANVEFKSFSKKLKQRLKETLPRYLSAFANTSGGFLFIGIDDETKAVVGCGKGMTPDDLEGKIRKRCNRAQHRAIHLHHCPEQTSWTPEVKVIPVTGAPEGKRFIIAVKIPPFCCAVFEEDPKSWVMEEGEIIQLGRSDWLKGMQRPIPETSHFSLYWHPSSANCLRSSRISF